MGTPDAPELITGELQESIEDALAAIDLNLLPEELWQNPLAQWVYSWREQSPLPVGGVSQPMLLSPVAEKFVNQALCLLIPFYLATLRLLGRSWRALEHLTSQIESAIRFDNLEDSVRLTEQHLGSREDLSPSELLLLTTARESPDVMRDALHDVLLEQLRSYTTRLSEIRSCWQVWRNEVSSTKESVEWLQNFAILVDAGIAPRDPEWLRSTISPVFSKPSSLPTQLASLSLNSPLFPTEELIALVAAFSTDAEHANYAQYSGNNAAHKGQLTVFVSHTMRDQGNFANLIIGGMGAGKTTLLYKLIDSTKFELQEGDDAKNESVENGSIDKQQLIRRVVINSGASRRESTTFVNAILNTIHDILASDDEKRQSPLSTITVRDRAKVIQQSHKKASAPSSKKKKSVPSRDR